MTRAGLTNKGINCDIRLVGAKPVHDSGVRRWLRRLTQTRYFIGYQSTQT